MADDDIATRAPESDAQEAAPTETSSAIPGDSRVDQGPASMGEHCTTDRPTPLGETPTGEMTKFADVDTYITKPADYPHSPCKLLLLLTGGTGVHSTNNQLQADKYAAEGFLVVMPDQFAGDHAPGNAVSTETPEENQSLIDQVKQGISAVAKSFTIDMWLARHTPEKVLPHLHRVLKAVAEEFADAIASGGGVYTVGYCFGAKYALLLSTPPGKEDVAGENADDSKVEEGRVQDLPKIKAGAIAHGTQITKEDFDGVAAPMFVVAVEDDPLFPEEVRIDGVKKMKENGLECEEKVYPGVPHGFAVLGDYQDSKIVESQKDAFEQMLGWLKAH
ncbi:Hypothetical protein R9X50_00344400 [Acrodontium crateriforme]|uniref:Dienelactone hydrolase domain-containing protein n=1 Tax=Acrodontium crateriforme TaxID=150365 RepID=A0AAQ3R7F7_9PEZI|nr:Hypothetical protein R9X50_00344400 [Acrodontium crateriforme]